jgi:DNA-binding XRE family transcriptional regulator
MGNVATQWSPAKSRLLLAVTMDPAEIGRRLKHAREAKLWTQVQFASQASVSPSTVARWEGGKLPPVRELMRVAKLLGVDPEWLVEPPNLPGRADELGRLDRLEGEVSDVRRILAQIARALGVDDSPPTEDAKRAL